jgi:signal transduction histidine kinase
MVKRVAKTSQTAFVTEIANIDAIVEKKAQIHLYRIVQEAVSNVVTHAHARHASVTITSAGGSVDVRIADDGLGFRPAPDVPASPGQGFGLIGIRERARILGGEVAIHSVPGGGTTITVTFRTARSET